MKPLANASGWYIDAPPETPAMTRLALCATLACSALAADAAAQTYANPGAASRYAPRVATVPQGPAPQAVPAGQQPQGQAVQYQGQPAGPQPNQQQPVRPVAGQEPIRQPVGPAAPVQPAGGPVAQPAVGPVANPAAMAGPQQPSWVPLDPAHEQWVDQILKFWEERSNKVKTLSCNFTRWDYDPVFGPREPNVAKTIAKGEIKYAQADKGLFKVVELMNYAPPAKAGDQPTYVPQDATFGEHWVCDGVKVFEFDARNKRVIERTLPPNMQGKAIADGPLPFLFGAKAQTIKARYWVRGIEGGPANKYLLEAVPKSRQDAQNFQSVKIVLDQQKFLPEGMQILAPNFNARTNPAFTSYTFADHEVTDTSINPLQWVNIWGLFQKNFYEPKVPSGWKKVVEGAGGQAALVPGAPAPEQATAPQTPRPGVAPLPR